MIKNPLLRNLICFALPCLTLLSACDGNHNPQVQVQSGSSNNSTMSIGIPERIRTSQAVDLQATRARIVTNTDTFNLTRDGDGFTGSIDVESGSMFTFTLTIYEIVDGKEIDYVKTTGRINEPVIRDIPLTIRQNDFVYQDTDGDGASNLDERNAGSNHEDNYSTPADPDGAPPIETNPGRLQFAATDYSVAERDGTLTITVTRTGGSDGAVSAQFAIKSETATVGSDFDSNTGRLVWQDGEAGPKNFTVAVRNDNINEGEETFTAHVYNPSGNVGIGNGFARITLQDSTPPAQRGTIQFVSNGATVNENAGRVTLEIERVNGSDGAVIVDYSTAEGTATETDFTAINQSRVAWADGEDGVRTISINISNDSEVEPAERFTVNLVNSLGGATVGLSTATVTITDTTVVPVPGQLAIAQNTYIANEGSTVNVVVERLNGSDGAVTVNYTINAGTASAADFRATDGVLSWPTGDANPRNITIAANSDSELEVDEQLSVTLLGPTGGATIGSPSVAVTISDSTVARPGVIAFSAASVSVDEGGSTAVTVSRTGGSNGAVSVAVNVAASAEYSVSPATLSWADGNNAAQTVTISAATDDVFDDSQTIILQLAEATGGASIGAGRLTVTLNDTTAPPPPPPPEGFVGRATDGEWEVCIAPYNTSGPTAFATQLSANEGRIVNCIKTCPETIVLDDDFEGWGWNATDLHSCTPSTDAPGTYTKVPVYTPRREVLNTNLKTNNFVRNNSIWGCIKESRQNAEFNYVADNTGTIWYEFLDDGTYNYSSSTDNTQPATLLGPDTWSVNGRVLELGHLNVGYRNVLFFPGNQTLHIHPTTDDRLSCTRQKRTAPENITPTVTPVVIPTEIPATVEPPLTN